MGFAKISTSLYIRLAAGMQFTCNERHGEVPEITRLK